MNIKNPSAEDGHERGDLVYDDLSGPCTADGCECAERDTLVPIPIEAAEALLRLTESLLLLRDAYVSRCLRVALSEVPRG